MTGDVDGVNETKGDQREGARGESETERDQWRDEGNRKKGRCVNAEGL